MPLNDQPADRSDDAAAFDRNRQDAGEPEGADLLRSLKTFERRHESFMATLQSSAWQESLRAYNNEHSVRSKYRHDSYRDRSKNFRPKTRSAVRKNMASCAAAMFSNNDVISVKAERDSDPQQQASAAVLHELLNYRLDRTAARSGIPWFLTVMGAELDSQITSICVTKQYWDYAEAEEPVEEEIEEENEVLDEAGNSILDEAGQPAMMVTKSVRKATKTYITHDRPMCENIPPENVMLDPAAHWINPAQSSAYFTAKFPMTREEAEAMMDQGGRANVQWLDVDPEILTKAQEGYTAKGVRTQRQHGGLDRQDRAGQGGSGANETPKSDIVWMWENFVRIRGVDYHFWSIGSFAFASKVRPTRQSYPEQLGERPYVYGYGAIESHNPFPMSPVESWQQMQREINDLVNLRLDTMKQALSPIAVVKHGTMFDWKQLQRRGGANANIMVNSLDDLKFERTPDVAGSAYQEMNYMNADFDDLSGSFSGGSVSTNRSLNETVGGMRLLSGSANAMTEFDLRIFVESWAEPTVRQLVRLEQMWESDEAILTLAGERARLERFGVDYLTDEHLLAEMSVRVNVGIGAVDPMQALNKLIVAMESIAKAAPFFDRKPTLKADEFIKEIMGKAGYNDGMRFFDMEAPDTPPPEVIAEQMKQQLAKAEMMLKAQIAQGDNQSREKVARLQAAVQMVEAMLREQGEQQRFQIGMEAEQMAQTADRFIEVFRESQRAGMDQARIASSERMATNAARERAAAQQQQARQGAAGAGSPQ